MSSLFSSFPCLLFSLPHLNFSFLPFFLSSFPPFLCFSITYQHKTPILLDPLIPFNSSPSKHTTFSKMSSPSKRRDMDVMKLMMSDYTVEPINDEINKFNVEFHGPKESLYEGGVWKVRVELPDAYPYKSPSIGFLNKIFHPNVDELSGSVCLDVINQSWSPMFDLLNVFEVFLPQLLLYPNPSDPLNGDAASLMMKDKKQYDQKVKEYCERYAKKENISTQKEESDEELSDEYLSGQSDSEDEVAGHADP